MKIFLTDLRTAAQDINLKPILTVESTPVEQNSNHQSAKVSELTWHALHSILK